MYAYAKKAEKIGRVMMRNVSTSRKAILYFFSTMKNKI